MRPRPKLRAAIDAWVRYELNQYRTDASLDSLVAHLDAFGYDIIEKATRRRENRHHDNAEADRRAAVERYESVFAWGQRQATVNRHLSDRCSYLYQLAATHGATDTELFGPDPPNGAPLSG